MKTVFAVASFLILAASPVAAGAPSYDSVALKADPLPAASRARTAMA